MAKNRLTMAERLRTPAEEGASSGMPLRGDVTELLLAWNAGNDEARTRLVSLVYRDLRERARRVLGKGRHGDTLQPTALVHETFEKLVDQRRVSFRDRAHFFGVTAALMRRILVDHARRRRALRRGGGRAEITLSSAEVAFERVDEVEVITVDTAITELEALDPGQARIVELRFFGGLSVEETAEALGISRATVHRDWAMARAWLRQRLLEPESAR
jgi:RNA polymerase sigma factor (TIGR02999 family)